MVTLWSRTPNLLGFCVLVSTLYLLHFCSSHPFQALFHYCWIRPSPCLGTDSRVLSSSLAMTAAGDTGIVPVSPYHSALAVVCVRGLSLSCGFFVWFGLMSFFFFFFLSCKGETHEHFFEPAEETQPSCHIRVCLLENEMPNKSVLEHHLMGKVMYWLRTMFLAFSRKPDLQQWLGKLPKPHTNILFPDGLPSTLCSIDILIHFLLKSPVLGTVGKYSSTLC